MVTLQWASFEHGRCRGVRGREGIIYGTRGGSDARARHPRTTFFPMKKLFVSHSCPFVVLLFHLSCISWFIPSSTYARRKRRAGAPSTHYFLPYEKTIRVPFVSIRGSIIPPFVYFVVHSLLNIRAAEATRGRAIHALLSSL